MLVLNNVYKERVIDIDYKGDGYVIIDDKYISIEGSLPNELVTFKLVNINKKNGKGKLLKVIEQNPNRVGFLSNLGSDNFSHTNFQFELDYQREVTKNTFLKALKKDININDTITDDKRYNYRNKVTFHVLEEENITLGIYKRNSKQLIKINDFNLASQSANNILKLINESNIKINYKLLKHIQIKNDLEDNLLITLISFEDNFEGLNSLIKLIKTKKYVKGITLNIKENNYNILGKNSILKYGENLLNVNNLLVNDLSFLQVNFGVMNLTYDIIKKYVEGDVIADLYSGVGSIILSVLSKDKKGIMVENNPENIKLANKIKTNKNISNLEIIQSDANMALLKNNIKADTFIVDPPQSGLGNDFSNNILNSKPKILIYLSCNLNTLINDLKIIIKDYEINEVYPIRMFPLTNSFETLVILKLNNL